MAAALRERKREREKERKRERERESERERERESSIARETVMSRERVAPSFSMKRKLDARFLLPIFLQLLRPL